MNIYLDSPKIQYSLKVSLNLKEIMLLLQNTSFELVYITEAVKYKKCIEAKIDDAEIELFDFEQDGSTESIEFLFKIIEELKPNLFNDIEIMKLYTKLSLIHNQIVNINHSIDNLNNIMNFVYIKNVIESTSKK